VNRLETKRYKAAGVRSIVGSMTSSVDTTMMRSVVGSKSSRGPGAAENDNVEACSSSSSSSNSILDGDEVNNAHHCTARLAQLLDSGKLSDVTLVVGSRRYRCHRLLLANASSVLE